MRRAEPNAAESSATNSAAASSYSTAAAAITAAASSSSSRTSGTDEWQPVLSRLVQNEHVPKRREPAQLDGIGVLQQFVRRLLQRLVLVDQLLTNACHFISA